MPMHTLHIGDSMPSFRNLRGVDARLYSSDQFTKGVLVIVFSCNHCPYVQAYEDRMSSLQQTYASKGVNLVAINSNEIENYPEDDYEHMVVRAKEKGFPFAYLRDDDQSVADAFGATHTPQFFLFDKDRKLRYTGKFDDNWKEPGAVKEKYLQDAVDALLIGAQVRVPETHSIGCTIKWK